MSENSKIEWTDHTFNPFIGCTKVSSGCDHCYAEHLMDKRMHKVIWGPHGERVRTSAATWRQPLRWNARHAEFFAAHGRRQRVFCASLADVFDNAVDPAWRADLFDLIEKTPNLDWLLLTKRIGNVLPMISETAQRRFDLECIESPQLPTNVWLGATVVNQAEADRDIPKLLAMPARVRFLSMEPLLGPVDLASSGALWADMNGNIVDAAARGLRAIDWVIVGGESGHGARPMHPDWARSLRDQCAAAGVAFLFKQWGQWVPYEPQGDSLFLRSQNGDRLDVSGMPGFTAGDLGRTWMKSENGNIYFKGLGKSISGRYLDGRTHDEFPRGAV